MWIILSEVLSCVWLLSHATLTKWKDESSSNLLLILDRQNACSINSQVNYTITLCCLVGAFKFHAFFLFLPKNTSFCFPDQLRMTSLYHFEQLLQRFYKHLNGWCCRTSLLLCLITSNVTISIILFFLKSFQSVYQWLVKPQSVIKTNEMFLPGRMSYIFDMVSCWSKCFWNLINLLEMNKILLSISFSS